MRDEEEADKREHSTKPEVDDLTDYQSLNSLGRAGVLGEAKETPATGTDEAAEEGSSGGEPATGVKYSGDYNDGADFDTVDNKGRTNA
jgi:hypothetical protein